MEFTDFLRKNWSFWPFYGQIKLPKIPKFWLVQLMHKHNGFKWGVRWGVRVFSYHLNISQWKSMYESSLALYHIILYKSSFWPHFLTIWALFREKYWSMKFCMEFTDFLGKNWSFWPFYGQIKLPNNVGRDVDLMYHMDTRTIIKVFSIFKSLCDRFRGESLTPHQT